MKQTRMIVLIALLSVAAFAAAWSPPVDLSLQGIVNWMGMNGHISAGTSLPAVASSGTRFTLTSPNPARPVDYKSNGSAWLPMWTWNHANLSNLSYSISGHGIVPVNMGGTGGTTQASAHYNLDVFSKASTTALIPLNASFTFNGLASVPVAMIDYATDSAIPAYREGRTFWDADNGCLAMYPEAAGPILQIGQEMWIRVKNAGVATMTNGSVVHLSMPLTGKDPVANLACANNPASSSVVGVITHDIPPDGNGYATSMGLVRNLNTYGFTEGQKVYLSATVPGSFTATLPASPNTSVIVGYVLKAHATAGVIYVRIWLNGSIERATFTGETFFQAPPTFASDTTLVAKVTSMGGYAIALINGSGVVASAGNVVVASSTPGYFTLAPADSQSPIGAVYEAVAPGVQGWVVVSGVGEVKMADTETATAGWLLLVDDGEVGRAMSATAIPPTTQVEHNREIGHTISTQPSAGGLVKAVLHFN